MIGTLTLVTTLILAVTTICMVISYLNYETAEKAIESAANQKNIKGWVQGLIDSAGNNHAKFSLSKGGRTFAKLDITYTHCSGNLHSGRKIGTYVS